MKQQISLRPDSVINEDGKYKLTLKYEGTLTAQGATEATSLVKACFTELPTATVNALYLIAEENKWSDQEFKDRVMHVIKTCKYPRPTIANFLDYKTSIDLKTWDEWSSLNVNEIPKYQAVKLPGRDKPLWASKYDIETYNLELFKRKWK